METSMQKIIAAIVGVMILFIIPVYIAFEKVDDVSYSLALKLTQNFVDNVRDKGYISPEMYSDFVSGLYSTNIPYDVDIEHVKKRYDPAIYIYEKRDDDTKGRLLHVLDYNKYAPDGDLPSEITIEEGIYNQTNSNIIVNSASITKANGSRINFTNGGALVLTPEELYKLKIDEYKELNRIILDKGEIYADVDRVLGANFDKQIYIPSKIILNDGRMRIINKQGTEPNTLDYNTYISNYDRAIKNRSSSFDGPTYNNSNSVITYTPASMKVKNGNTMTDIEMNELYYKWINQYRTEQSSGDGRLVFDKGEVYADTSMVRRLGGAIDAKVDIVSDINKIKGTININVDKQIPGHETTLDYDTYISSYDSNADMVAFEGEIYNDGNSDIVVTRAAMWVGDKNYSELTDDEKDDAENLYGEKIHDSIYEGEDTIVFDKGEIYAESTSAVGYNKLTDSIRAMSVNGEIKVKSPTGFEPEYLNFTKYIKELRSTDKIVYESGNTYKNGQDGIEILHTLGSITDRVTGDAIDYNSNIEQYMDNGKTEITIPIIVTYMVNDIFLSNVSVTIKDKDTDNMVFDDLINGYVMDTLKDFHDNHQITIGGTTYTQDDYEITIGLPSSINLTNHAPSDYTILDVAEMEQTLNDYYNSGSVTKNFNKVYPKDDLKVKYEKLVINKDDEKIYEFYEYKDKDKYQEYLEQFNNNGSVYLEKKVFAKDELDVEYKILNIQGRSSITIDSTNLSYIEDYYQKGRVVIKEANIAIGSEIKVIHPRLDIYEKGTNNNKYYFRGNVETESSDYIKYLNEYKSDGNITIDPARVYKKEDVTVTRSKLVISPIGASGYSELIFEDNDTKYEDYVNQYETSGKVTIKEPEVYNINTDVDLQDAHIAITPKGYTNPIIDIYEKDVQRLYDDYVSQYLSSNKITLHYNLSDVSIYRANITIKELEKDEITNVYVEKGTGQVVYDNTDLNSDGVYEYIGFKNEFNKKGLITFSAANQYTAAELKVVDPSITVTDPNTGSPIVKYEADYSKLSDDERYYIYNQRVDEYGSKAQLINQKITYKAGDNCIIEKAHIMNEEHITDKQIVDRIFKDTGVNKVEFLRQCLLGNGDMYNSLAYRNENSYVMNEGDKINVTVRNRNQTIASVFYSLFTANVGNKEIAKIYVDYGGTIKNNGSMLLTNTSGIVDSETGRLFRYKGKSEEVTLAPGSYEIECWGAAGGGVESGSSTTGGKGAYTKAKLELSSETTLYVYVGGKGTKYSDDNANNGGYNGGGNSYNGYGGGGATDIRLLKGEWDDKTSLLTRIMVAAGGGGASGKGSSTQGGIGGNLTAGGNGLNSGNYYGIGAKSSSVTVGYDKYINASGEEFDIESSEKGTFGKGGSVDFDGAGAGGGGYYGGSSSHNEYLGGGGGLSYIYDMTASTAHRYKDGKYYPINSKVADFYDTEVLDGIIDFSNNRILDRNK